MGVTDSNTADVLWICIPDNDGCATSKNTDLRPSPSDQPSTLHVRRLSRGPTITRRGFGRKNI